MDSDRRGGDLDDHYEDLFAKYRRFGAIDQGRFCDRIANLAVELLPGGTLPHWWTTKRPEEFLAKYGEGFWWAKAMSSHMLIYDGVHQFRIWTRTSADWVVTDISHDIAWILDNKMHVIPIEGEKNLKKRKPFRNQIGIRDEKMLALLIAATKTVNHISPDRIRDVE